MNRLHRGIAQLCRQHVLEEKWLLAPSRRVGQQCLEAVTRSGQALVNVHVQTLKALAMSLASGAMVEAGTKLISARASAILIGQAWSRRRREGYLFGLPARESLCQAVSATLSDLRLAGLGPKDIRPDRLEVATKGKELAVLLGLYEDELKARKSADYAGVLKMAVQSLRGSNLGTGFPLVLLPGDLELATLEHRLLEAIPKDRLVVLPVDEPGKPSQDVTDAAALRWILSPAEAPAPTSDGTAGIFHAIGEVNEVREVLRRCLADGTPLDDVELLYTDGQSYVPLIYELGRRLEADPAAPGQGGTTGEVQPAGLRITFAEGIPVRYSRPGRTLAAWLQWISEDYPQTILVRMIQDGLLEIPRVSEGGFGFTQLAGMLRAVPIGFGRDRYLPQLDEQIAALGRQLRAGQASDENGETDADRPTRTGRRLAGLKMLRELVSHLLRTCPAGKAKASDIFRSAIALLEDHARCVSDIDTLARPRLLEDIFEMVSLLGEAGDDAGIDPWEYLASLPAGLRVGGSGPRPGCLHCAPVLSGGHSGRSNTFIIGLDDQRFPGGGLQDPILLDSERNGLSADLPTAAGHLRGKMESFARLLARLRGKVTLGYASRDLVEDREAFPSPILLAAFRIMSGQRQGDQADLAKWLAPPASFVPSDDTSAIDQVEWWMWRTCGTQAVKNPRQVVAEEFRHLGRGMSAAERRASEDFTEYDGRVGSVSPEHDPVSAEGPALSPSALETIGRCPLAYFFKYVLRIELPEELLIDRTRWLDPATFGSLLHDVFCLFMRELLAGGKLPPDYNRDRGGLEKILAARIEEYKRLIPPPNEWAFRRQRQELQQAVRIFLAAEQRHCQDRWPAYMEASIGLRTSEAGTLLDSVDPVRLPLGGGKSIRIRGRIDRIDRIGDPQGHAFALWDYKTGSTWRFRQEPPFWQGRVLQHAVYLHLALDRLRQIHPKADVKEVGYFFPSRRGRGERLTHTPQELGEGLAILQRLCRLVGDGAFLATDNTEEDCTYCDYVDICGDLTAVSQASQRKLQGTDKLLDPLRELRGYDEQE